MKVCTILYVALLAGGPPGVAAQRPWRMWRRPAPSGASTRSISLSPEAPTTDTVSSKKTAAARPAPRVSRKAAKDEFESRVSRAAKNDDCEDAIEDPGRCEPQHHCMRSDHEDDQECREETVFCRDCLDECGAACSDVMRMCGRDEWAGGGAALPGKALSGGQEGSRGGASGPAGLCRWRELGAPGFRVHPCGSLQAE